MINLEVSKLEPDEFHFHREIMFGTHIVYVVRDGVADSLEEVRDHVPFAFDVDCAAATKLVPARRQDVVHFLRHLHKYTAARYTHGSAASLASTLLNTAQHCSTLHTHRYRYRLRSGEHRIIVVPQSQSGSVQFNATIQSIARPLRRPRPVAQLE